MIKACPFCHHEKAELAKRGELLRDGTPRDIYRCSVCGLLYPKPRMGEKESSEFIAGLYGGEGEAAIDDPTRAADNFTKRKFLEPKGYMVNLGLLVRKYDNIEPGKVLRILGRRILVKCHNGAVLLTGHEFKVLPKIGEYLL